MSFRYAERRLTADMCLCSGWLRLPEAERDRRGSLQIRCDWSRHPVGGMLGAGQCNRRLGVSLLDIGGYESKQIDNVRRGVTPQSEEFLAVMTEIDFFVKTHQRIFFLGCHKILPRDITTH